MTNYKRLGDYIQLVNVRNKELKVKTLLGLTVNKLFIPSVANTVGTNMANYKIIHKGQFACSLMQVRRDKKMPVALLRDFDKAIISQAYPVFEVIDTKELNPEYLMMWFSRKEFDRHALFLAVGGVRGSLEWGDFCDMQLPIPSKEKQNAIVKEYNTIVNRIKLNEQLNQKLEETAQAIYKHWFVNFEFPNEAGEPYKSSGGKMVFNEELEKEIPEGWEVDSIGNNIETIGGGTPSTNINKYWENGDIIWYSPTDLTKNKQMFSSRTTRMITKLGLKKSSAKLLPPYSLLMTSRATIGELTINLKMATTNQGFITLIPTDKLNVYFLYSWIKTKLNDIKLLASGSTFLEISKSDFRDLKILLSGQTLIDKYSSSVEFIFNNIKYKDNEIENLIKLKDLLLAKMSKLNTKKEIF